jgi:hypothetical protein
VSDIPTTYSAGSIVARCDWDGEIENARFIVLTTSEPRRLVSGYCIWSQEYGFNLHELYPLETYRLRILFNATKQIEAKPNSR